jgi:hypothetical protein
MSDFWHNTNTVKAKFFERCLTPKPIPLWDVACTSRLNKGEVRMPTLINYKAVFAFMNDSAMRNGFF